MKIFDKIILSEDEVLNKIEVSLAEKQSLLVTYLNVHCYNLCRENENYVSLLKADFTVYTDGTGIWLMMKKIGKFYKRFNATDLNYIIIEIIKKKSSRVFFIGANIPSEIIEERMKNTGLNFCGYLSGFIDEGESINQITASKPDLVFVGMGVPKQELFAYKLSNSLNNSVIVCVGNFFEFYFGTQKRAPKLFRKFGIEWLHRLYLEPKRLFKRYTIGNILFVIDLIKRRSE